MTPGDRIGPYEVVGLVGSGGMGEVYRARDSKLNRDVAIKILPEALAADPIALARFEREAHVLASLNHPHIAHLYGFEAGPPASFLVMELVDGPTLADVIKTAPGGLPLDQVLLIARQIADALEAAHEQAIIHRDLKPANIKVRDDGVVKVLDFGLAKAVDPVSSSGVEATNSPTMIRLRPDFAPRASSRSRRSASRGGGQGYGVTGGEPGTEAGLILGTAAYMAPEQARGKPVDKRADVWAFGVVLYEMLTGRRLFDGEDLSETLAAVLRQEVSLAALPAATPWRLTRLLGRCLERDPKQRLRDIGEARIEIARLETGAADHSAAPAPVAASASVAPRWRRALPWVMIGVTGTALVAVLGFWPPWRAPPARAPLHVSLTLPSSQPLSRFDAEKADAHASLALSPDGTHLVYVADQSGAPILVDRDLSQSEGLPIPGTEGGSNPFFSPDGRWIGFFAAGKLKKVALSGGAPTTLAEFAMMRGASWGSDDVIVVSPGLYSGLARIRAETGGPPQPLTTLNEQAGERSHRWPDILPGGRAILYAVGTGGSFDDARIVAQTLDGKIRNLVIDGGTYPRYVPTGHIVYAHAGSLWAVPFDAVRLERRGTPVKVLDGVATEATGAAQFTFSNAGTLLAATGGLGSATSPSTIAWVSRSGGTVEPIVSISRQYDSLHLSPDGKRLAVVADVKEVLIFDLKRRTALPLFSGRRTNSVAWMSNASVTLSVEKTGGWNLFSKRADGGEAEKELLPAGPSRNGAAWSEDGTFMVFVVSDPRTGSDLWVHHVGEAAARPLLAGPANESQPRVSPKGDFFAYVVEDALGVLQVFVRPFPEGDAQWPVSVQSGSDPVWSHDGTELFYREGRRLMGAKVRYSPSFDVGTPTVVLDELDGPYDADHDGRRFVTVRPVAALGATIRLDVITDWYAELVRRMGARR